MNKFKKPVDGVFVRKNALRTAISGASGQTTETLDRVLTEVKQTGFPQEKPVPLSPYRVMRKK